MNQQAMSAVDWGTNFAVGGVVGVQAADLDLELALPYPADIDVGLAEDGETGSRCASS